MSGTILITGGTGFVGGQLAGRLRRRFPASRVIVAGSEPATGGAAEFAQFDLLDPPSIRGLIASARPTALIQLAGVTHVQEAQASGERVWRANVMGVAQLAEAVLELAPECRVLHVSSGEVYGVTANDKTPLAEDDRLRPANLYAVTKCAAELALQEATLRGLRLVIARPFNHTGPTQQTRFVVPRIVSQVARIAAGKAEPVLRLGALDRARDFLHVHDVCDAYVAIVEAFDRLEGEAVFNIASGVARTIQSVVDDTLSLAGVEAAVLSEPSALRPFDVVKVCGDASRARVRLGWRPSIAWADLLKEMFDHHLAAARAEA
jgi:GDP-4-dehydro-6-deoxy-D-mannose reductase